jgi:hypothetical protein
MSSGQTAAVTAVWRSDTNTVLQATTWSSNALSAGTLSSPGLKATEP